MIDLGLDPSTGDLALVERGAILIEDVDQIAQNLAIRLRFFQGEWYLDTTAGLPYFESFFLKNPNQIQIQSFLLDEIANTEGVQEILDFSSTYDGTTRTFGVRFIARTVLGLIEIDQELP